MKKLFGKRQDKNGPRRSAGGAMGLEARTRVLSPLPTVRLGPEDLMPPARLEWFGQTDRGVRRDHNEDSCFCAGCDDTGLFVVADGMGGHDSGEVASRLAVETVCREIRAGAEAGTDPIELITFAVQRANRAVRNRADGNGSNMGTTLAVALVAEGAAYVANVGDSRAYWMENGSIRQVTEDHSVVARLVAAGRLTKEEARSHPRSNVLYRTVGSDGEVKVDTFTVPLGKGGGLLLGTDGLWGEVADDEIHRICTEAKSVREACAALVGKANENGGKDNITAVLVRFL
jgi:protein phosphatase